MARAQYWGAAVTVLFLALGVAFSVACGGDDADDHLADMDTPMDTMADGDGDHAEGDDHVGEGGAEVNAYLEAAPKDALFLVEMSSFAFTPNALEVRAGEVVEIAIQNVDSLVHDFTIDEIDADVHISYLAGTGEHVHAEPEREGDVHFALTEPGTGVVHISVHEPGDYVFYCAVPGHREAGMQGTLTVVE